MKAWKELLVYVAVLGLLLCIIHLHFIFITNAVLNSFSSVGSSGFQLKVCIPENGNTLIFTAGVGRLDCVFINVSEMVKPRTKFRLETQFSVS